MRSKKVVYFHEVFFSYFCMETWAGHILGLVTDVNHILVLCAGPIKSACDAGCRQCG